MPEELHKLEKLRKMIHEVIKDGFGEVVLKIVVKNSKIEHMSLTKTITSKLT